MKQYELFELNMQGEAPVESEAIVDIEAVFTCNGTEHKVKGFYDGNGVYKVRFLPKECGIYTWKVQGIITGEGREECVKGDAHGMVRAEKLHFVYEDGTSYIPFGTTVYALVHQEEELMEETFHTLQKAPFNKIRHCVFPKSYLYNENEPKHFAFKKDASGKWDVNRPDYDFWHGLEKAIFRLAEMGIQSDLILFHPYDRWGFAEMSMEENEIYLRYALRRLSAIPYIWWSMANEYDLCFAKTKQDWEKIEDIIKEEDIYGHLLSNHYCMKFYDYTRKNLTHCSMQNVLFYKMADFMKKYKKPVVFDECCYEGDIDSPWGNISAEEMVHRFWCAYCIGAFATHGETYFSEDDVLWWAKGGTLKGESPSRIAFLREIMEKLPTALTLWEEPIFILNDPDFYKKKKEDNPVYKLQLTLNEMERDAIALKDTLYTGCCKEDIFIKYYGIQRPSKSFMILPENRSYTIEVIDTWNQTKEVLVTGASGITWFTLPGKTGLAVMAIAE